MPPEQKSNPLVEKAVNALNEKISHLRRLRLYEALKQGILLVGTRYLPDHLQSSEYIKDPAIPLPELCATSEAADGSANLWAFTHHAALVNHLKDAPYLYLDAR